MYGYQNINCTLQICWRSHVLLLSKKLKEISTSFISCLAMRFLISLVILYIIAVAVIVSIAVLGVALS